MELIKTKITAHDGTPVRLEYDPEGDILEVFFGENEKATGIELTDQILIRVNQQSKQAVSLTLLDFSILTERTEFGPRSFALNRLDNLPGQLKELTFRLINSYPISQFLKISQFQASSSEHVPMTYVESQPELLAA